MHQVGDEPRLLGHSFAQTAKPCAVSYIFWSPGTRCPVDQNHSYICIENVIHGVLFVVRFGIPLPSTFLCEN